MENKVALITGSSRGLGKEIALEFAKQGFDVVIHCLKEQQLAYDLQKEIEEKFKVKTLVVFGDIAKEKEVRSFIDKIFAHFSKIDVLVNNAAISDDTLLELKDESSFNRVLEVNLTGSFLVTKYVAESMLKNKTGNIIFIASTNGLDTYYPYSIDYDASKAGVISLMHNYAVSLAPYIRVNAVAPGWINTSMNKDLTCEQLTKEKAHILLGRFAEPKEVAKVVYFLTSDDASYINNTVIRVDGGSFNGY